MAGEDDGQDQDNRLIEKSVIFEQAKAEIA
jgi:hypothetical protein